MVVLFDNEEIGSVSAHGAGSNLLEVTIERLASINVQAASQSEMHEVITRVMINDPWGFSILLAHFFETKHYKRMLTGCLFLPSPLPPRPHFLTLRSPPLPNP